MEYEICGEERLFDESTNPSLVPERHRPARSAKPQGDPARRKAKQSAEVIPEEEPTQQMG
jgi:hypothetical protein